MTLPKFDVIDLTHALSTKMPLYPGDKPFKLKKNSKQQKETGLISHTMTLAEHIGTHVDAPLHFDPKGRSIDQVPADQLVLPTVMVDMREQALGNPEYRFSVEEFLEWEEQNGWIPPYAMVILHTGWGLRWHKPAEYLGVDDLGTPHFPGFGSAVAEFLAEERSVKALGIDTASVDVGQSSTYPVHRSMLARNILLAENLANCHTLPDTPFLVSIGALKIKGGSGTPARVLAMIPKPEPNQDKDAADSAEA